jgi:hypothetical protein
MQSVAVRVRRMMASESEEAGRGGLFWREYSLVREVMVKVH